MIKKNVLLKILVLFIILTCRPYPDNNTLPQFNMVSVTGGTFKLGATDPDMTVSSFIMAETEVTQELWQAVMGNNPIGFSGAKLPVESSWYDALEFCNKLSILDGKTPVYSIAGSTDPDNWGTPGAAWDAVIVNWAADGYRLPSEMEWMWAAMGGAAGEGVHSGGIFTDGYSKQYAGHNRGNDPSGSNIGNYAWYSGNSGNTTHDVKGKTANELGLYDMSGNVYEWCWDLYGSYPVTEETDYHGPAGGSHRVGRGGSWFDSVSFCTVASRNNFWPNGQSNIIGFRFVRKAD